MPPRKKAATAANKTTPAKKTAAKKKPAGETPQVLVLKTDMVPINTLSMYHDNPRIGDVRGIAKSLHVNGQYKPIVVNKGTYTGRPNEIVAGNHTYLAARQEVTWQEDGVGYDKPVWTHIYASFVDVDEDAAKRIVLADNKTAEDSTYDDEILARLLNSLPDVSGTGYDPAEANKIIESFNVDDLDEVDLEGALDSIDVETLEDDDTPRRKRPKFSEVPLGDEDEAGAEDDRPDLTIRQKERLKDQGVDINRVSSELKGNFQLTDDPVYDFVTKYDIPRMLDDEETLMQPDDIPENLKTWAGSATKDEEDESVFWFYNFGIDSTAGMQDISRMIVAFFTWDEYFEGWWFQPSKFVSKILNSKVKYIGIPDFSPDIHQGFAFNLWQFYRMQYLARYFQEAGLKVLPHVTFPDGDIEFLRTVVLPALPDHIPVLVQQAQTINFEDMIGGKERYIECFQLVIDTLKPKVLILYAGNPGRELWSEVNMGDTEVIHLEHRQTALSAKAKGRKKKDTL